MKDNKSSDSFHGNQYVDSQGKHKSDTQNTGGQSQTGGKSTGSSHTSNKRDDSSNKRGKMDK